MKQYVTENQFKKLPGRAQEVLKDWIVEKGYAMNDYTHVSIGQLIEFLAEMKKDVHIERFDGGKEHSHWDISTCYEEGWKFGREQKELCDALWEVVKEELRGNYASERQKLFKGKSITNLYKEAKKLNRK